MPLFEFECPSCHRRIERIFSRVEQADAEKVICVSPICPSMKRAVMSRVATAANFQLKGPGWTPKHYSK